MTVNGIIKTLIILALVALTMMYGTGANTHYSVAISVVPPLFLGLILAMIIGFATSFIKNVSIVKLNWNDSILSFHKPLSIIHFFGYLLIALGLAGQFVQWLKNNDFHQAGIVFGTFGIGLILGIWATVKLRKNAGKSG